MLIYSVLSREANLRRTQAVGSDEHWFNDRSASEPGYVRARVRARVCVCVYIIHIGIDEERREKEGRKKRKLRTVFCEEFATETMKSSCEFLSAGRTRQRPL